MEVSGQAAAQAARLLKVDLSVIPGGLQGWRRGIGVETEHGSQDAQTDVTGDKLMPTAKIALAHFKEDLWYYERLLAAEKRAKAEWSMHPGGMPPPVMEQPEDGEWPKVRDKWNLRFTRMHLVRRRIVKEGTSFARAFPIPPQEAWDPEEEPFMRRWDIGSEADMVAFLLQGTTDIEALARIVADMQITPLEKRLYEVWWFDRVLTAKAALGLASDQPLSNRKAALVFVSDWEVLRPAAWNVWQAGRGERAMPRASVVVPRRVRPTSGVWELNPREEMLAAQLSNPLGPLWMAEERAIRVDGLGREPSRRGRWTRLWNMIVPRLERGVGRPWVRFSARHAMRVLVTFERGPSNATDPGIDVVGHFSDPRSLWYQLAARDKGEAMELGSRVVLARVTGPVVRRLSVAPKAPEDPRERPSPAAYLIGEGDEGPLRPLHTLVLRWDRTYLFKFDRRVSGGNHPLYLTTSSVGGASNVGESILTASKLEEIREALVQARQGSFEIRPSRDVEATPSMFGRDPETPVYYQCAVHPNMGWTLVLERK